MNFLLVYLAGIQAISEKLSTPGYGVRIYKRLAPENCPLPYCVITGISGRPDYMLAGAMPDLSKVFQLDVYAETDNEAEEIAETIRLAPLEGYRGMMNETYVHAVTIERESDPDDYRGDGSDTTYARASRDYRIHFDRAVVHSS